MKVKLLYVEDEFDLGNLTKQYLELMDFQVDWFTTARSALEYFRKVPAAYNVVIIDIQLPDMNGFDLSEQLLAINQNVYLVFLTSKKDKADRLKGLKIGAVDYITKPFDADELVLKIQNMVRHKVAYVTPEAARRLPETETICLGDMSLKKSQLVLSLPDELNVSLTQREADLIEYLYQRRNKVVKREEILRDLWGDNNYFLGRSLDVFISRLRKLFRDSQSVRIQNVHGVGFIFSVN
ncbi:DNA-binding response OmpR family regulator [Arcticibacter tournemirensis]|uniref:Response regulator transcription factor n=1 Tax=Arcticibacter tournemirensis TaxID=699437 RepID=A0A4Q0MA30_9SPHI|nr:response regulator transcription factor [Arcticibacter tournemirensis]KAA8485378.1 response regulator transcription factor [Arcticibacter tournemirensis]RXF70077.1 response regulator transcription factor [Arcticibacter tournemirensis]TQM50331.1 DNA-binding response OmpR family regulator [Arcticibacter tournemirensis]